MLGLVVPPVSRGRANHSEAGPDDSDYLPEQPALVVVGLDSVLRWKQEGCAASVRFLDDPNLLARGESVAGEEPQAVPQRELVLAAVGLIDVPPIPSQMAVEKKHKVVAGFLQSL